MPGRRNRGGQDRLVGRPADGWGGRDRGRDPAGGVAGGGVEGRGAPPALGRRRWGRSGRGTGTRGRDGVGARPRTPPAHGAERVGAPGAGVLSLSPLAGERSPCLRPGVGAGVSPRRAGRVLGAVGARGDQGGPAGPLRREGGQVMVTPREDGFRMPPEWGPHQAALMAWPTRTRAPFWGQLFEPGKRDYASVARAVAAFEPVIMVCDPGDDREVRDRCGAGVEPLEVPIDDSWMRDNGPIF